MPSPTPEDQVSSHPDLGERASQAILEAAAGALVERGEQASMSDVAAAAGVARATVYRHFPSRDALLEALGRVALEDAGERLSTARIAEVPVQEGIARAVRALVTVGDAFVVLARERARPDTDEFDARIATPLRELLARAQRHGEIRDDVPPEWLTESLFGLIVSVLDSGPPLGTDDTIAAIAGVFLDGARTQDHS